MSSVSSIRNGEWYQDLYGWSRILDLCAIGNLSLVRLEADGAGHVDDVVAHPRKAGTPVEFVQVKFHVSGELKRYSTSLLTELPPSARAAFARGDTSRAKSFLQKFSASWRDLKDTPGGAKLILVSNWGWQDGDPLQPLISGIHSRLDEEFYTEAPTSKIGVARETWRKHLALLPDEFEAFARSLHFGIGGRSRDELAELVSARMRDRGLKNDHPAILLVVAQVNRWICDGVQEGTPEMYERALDELDLRLSGVEPAIRVSLHSIERQTFLEAADHTLDWCEHYKPQGEER